MKIIKYDRIEENLCALLKTNLLCLVLKNDAYGFGMKNITRLALKHHVENFAVNTITEAIELRGLTDGKIIQFGNCRNDLMLLKAYRILPTASSSEEIRLYTDYKLPFALEVDSGMNRFGVKELEEGFLSNPYLDTVYVHFYKKKEENLAFMHRLAELCRVYRKAFHFGGSLAYGEHGYPLRVGRLIYRNSVELYGQIQMIKTVSAGETVGYEGEYQAQTEERIAVLNIGYYNGIRTFYDGSVYGRGKRYPVVGRVCMNHTFIRIDDTVKEGDWLEFFGNRITLEEFLIHNRMSEYESFLFIR